MVGPVQNPPPLPDVGQQDKPAQKARMKPWILRAGFLVIVIGAMFISNGCAQSNMGVTGEGENYTGDIGNGVTLDMVWIPAGSFLMGSPADEPGHEEDESPQTEVKLKGFWMGKYEVTQKQYQEVTDSNPSSFKGEDNPVDTVNWVEAMVFCKELSKRTGQHYTLPTEAQWEYADRAGTTTRYSFGDNADQLGNYAWFAKNSGETTHLVGSKLGNPWGLYDMKGNVSEWCLSEKKLYPYSETDGRNSLSNRNVLLRSLRSSSWYTVNPDVFRCAFRSGNLPNYHINGFGFRVVRNLE